MRWEAKHSFPKTTGHWLEAETPTGIWSVEQMTDCFTAFWLPCGVGAEVCIGRYRTEGAAKGACKRYAKKMAAAFKAMAKAGWQ